MPLRTLERIDDFFSHVKKKIKKHSRPQKTNLCERGLGRHEGQEERERIVNTSHRNVSDVSAPEGGWGGVKQR